MISFTKAVMNFYVKAFNFKGRATRAEYWWALLYILLLDIVYHCAIFFIIDNGYNINGYSIDDSIMILFCSLIFLKLPIISLIVRRLHDVGDTAWGLLFLCIPIVNLGFGIALGINPSDGDNKYGPMLSYEPKKHDNQGFWSCIIISLFNGAVNPFFPDRPEKPFESTGDKKYRTKESCFNKKHDEVEMP